MDDAYDKTHSITSEVCAYFSSWQRRRVLSWWWPKELLKYRNQSSTQILRKLVRPYQAHQLSNRFQILLKSMAVLVTGLVQNVKTICLLSYELWAEDVPWDLSLTCVLEGFVYCNNPPVSSYNQVSFDFSEIKVAHAHDTCFQGQFARSKYVGQG